MGARTRHYNSLGQPIGVPLADWSPPRRPPRAPMEGRACRLEPLDPDRHAAGLFSAFASDPTGGLWTYLPYGPFDSSASYGAWMTEAAAGDDPLFFAVELLPDRKPAGVASYLRMAPASGSIEVGHILYAPALQRTAAATEAMYLMMEQAFALGYRRYEWKCDALNTASRAAAERLGFSFEGIFRQATVYKGRNRDTAWYAAIDREWPALRAAFQAWLEPGNFDRDGRQRLRLTDLTRAALAGAAMARRDPAPDEPDSDTPRAAGGTRESFAGGGTSGWRVGVRRCEPLSMKKDLVGYAFIGPWLLGFLIFTAYPFVASIGLSFTRYDIVSPPAWVGRANYQNLLTADPLFWKSLAVTLRYALLAVPLGIGAGVGLALLLNQEVRGISVFRTIFYLPSIVPSVATAVVFVWILNPQIGLVNGLLRQFGIVGPAWLENARWAHWSLVFMSLWGVGGSMVIYLAGLKDIPRHLYEAALLDGAGAWQRTRAVTLPMLTPVIFFNLVMGVLGAFQYFTEAYIMTRGGPEDSTRFYALYLFDRAWRYLDMGYASAMAWILFLLVMVMTAFLFKTQRRWVHYGA